jgi:two-component system, chemotaxis family, sensor kinase CheA
MDALLDSITEAHSQLGALRRDESAAARARHLADLALDQLGAAGAGDLRQLRATLEELRGLTLGLDRSLPTKADRLARELEQVRAAAERLRLVPAAILFPVLERTAWDVARAQGKQVNFDSSAPGIRLDAHIVAAVQGALVQLVRNAVAHGIEPSAERVRAGKPAEGQVSVVVTRDGRRVTFACHDDGRGIDEGAVRRAARDRGQDVDGIDRAGLVDLLFQGGISTAGQLTEVSGRGVGLDVVREVAERLGGTAATRPRPGGGTTFELVVPLAMAAIEGLQVEAGGAVATIPLDAVRRTLRLAGDRVVRSDGGEAVVDGSDVIPFLPLAPLLGGAAPSRAQSWSAVIVQTPGGDAAVGVDRLVGTGTVVVRPLPPLATSVAAVAGASLDGEGNPRLFLDPGGLVAAARRRTSAAGTDAPPTRLPVLVIDDSLTTRMLEQSILDSAGYDVDTAASAEEGLVKAAARRYALFLVDVEMPGIDGFTFIERTQADPTLRDVPAILVTSRNAPEDLRRGQEVGAKGYVVKSEFDQVALLDHIRRLVG